MCRRSRPGRIVKFPQTPEEIEQERRIVEATGPNPKFEITPVKEGEPKK
jgi:hypothetical protein